MSRLRSVFYTIYAIYFIVLVYLCYKLLQVPDATEDAFYLYLKETFGGYFGVITFLEEYFRLFQIFTVVAVIFSLILFASDFFGKMALRRRIGKLEAEINMLKARLYDKQQSPPPADPGIKKPNLPSEKSPGK